MEARPRGSYSSICFHGYAKAGAPLDAELPETFQTVSHLSLTP